MNDSLDNLKDKKEILDFFYKLIEELNNIHKGSTNYGDFINKKQFLEKLCISMQRIFDNLNKNFEKLKLTEKELKEKEYLFNTFLEKLNVAIFVINVVDGEFIFDYLNPVHEMLTGLTNEMVKGKKAEEFVSMDIARVITQNYKKCIEAKTTIEYEEELFLKGEQTYWITRLIPFLNDNGEVYKIIGASININNLKKLNIKIENENRLLENIFNTVSIPIYYKDKELNFINCNKEFEIFFGITIDVLKKIKKNDFLEDNLKKEFDVLEKEVIEKKSLVEKILTYVINGEEKTFMIKVSPVIDYTGSFDGLVGSILDISSQVKYQKILKELAIRDELTGLYNRRGLNEFLDKEWKNSLRNKQPISILMIDIDYFKNYNDGYGHKAGDDALKEISNIFFKNTFRPYDIIARIGGEEFLIILPNTDYDGARVVAERIRKSVEEKQIEHKFSSFGVITVSIGIATSVPGKLERVEFLLEEADKNLYIAKNKGRNRIEGFNLILN